MKHRRLTNSDLINTKGMTRPFRVLTMLIVPVIGFAIASCDSGPSAPTPYSNSPEGKPPGLSSAIPDPKEVTEVKAQGTLPDFLGKLTGAPRERLTGLYQGAVDHYDAYSHIPCYCGCAVYTTAHQSLAQCFIKDMAADGSVTFTDHSTSCDICEGIAKMTLEGVNANKPLKDIRAAVFTTYKYTGIWTDTPPVP